MVSQPTLTVAIRQLEDAVGAALFERTTRRVSLTDEGIKFHAIVERLLHDYGAAVSTIRTLGDERRGRLSIAAVTSVITKLLPTALKRFSDAHPAVSVHVHDGNSSEVRERVKQNRVDIGFASITDDADLQFTPLFCDQMGLLGRPDHALMRLRRPLVWRDLDGHDFLGVSADTATKPLLESIPDLPPSARSPRYVLSSAEALEAMLLAGIGIATAPALQGARPDGQPLQFRTVGTPVIWRAVYVVTRKGRRLPPTVPRLVIALRDHVTAVCLGNKLVAPGDAGSASR